MKRIFLLSAYIFAGMLCMGMPLWAQSEQAQDKSMAPYFHIPGADDGQESLPLKSTQAQVNIAGVIADVQVSQVYTNTGNSPIEAVYVFPASTRAAVYGLRMKIGERVVEAKIRKRAEARQEYEDARAQGKNATLLEQQRPNVFQMQVANIMPGDEIAVELKYTELIVPESKVYEFVYPTVVGPRYHEAQASAKNETWVHNPYLHQGRLPSYSFDVRVNINGGMPIRDISSTSHKINTNFFGPNSVHVALDPAEHHSGNRDFVLRYRLDGGRIQTGLLLNQGQDENYFLLMLQPPKRVRTAEIPGREYIFIVDVSGSMHGFPLNISKTLLKDLIGGLRPADKFNVLLFAGSSALMAEKSLAATQQNIATAVNFIERQRGGGGTRLLPALQKALALPVDEDYSRSIIVATDGYVSVEEEAFDLIRSNLNGANLFAFGIGSSVNRHLIEGMAHVGGGEPFIVTKAQEAAGTAKRLREMISAPMLTGISVQCKGFDAYDIEPAQAPDVFSERPVIIQGKWRGKAEGSIIVSGFTGQGRFVQHIRVEKSKPVSQNSALRYLWARERIKLLGDYNKLRPNDKRIQQITDLGLRYNLLTSYTSFVAVDSLIRNAGGQQSTVHQPLPLPQGVSDYALGGMSVERSVKKLSAPMVSQRAYDAVSHKLVRPRCEEKESKSKDETQGLRIAVSNNLSQSQVRAYLQARLPDIYACLRGKTHKGFIEITMYINADGSVGSIQVHKASKLSSQGRKCLEKTLKTMVIPAPGDAKKAWVKIVLAVG